MKVVSYLSERERRIRSRRRRLFFMYISGIVGLGIIGIVWVVRYAPIFDVKHIVVEGNAYVSSDAILAVARTFALGSFWGKLLGIERIFAWPEGKEARLAFLPAVAEFTLSRSFRSQTVYIVVKERVPRGIWCLIQTRGCWWFDSKGILFARTLDGEGGLLNTVHDYSGRTLGVGMPVLQDSLMANLLTIFEVLRANGVPSQEVRLENQESEEVQVITYNGPRLYFSLRFPLGRGAQVMKEIFSDTRSSSGGFPPLKNLEYVDFRVENRVYYK